MASSSHHAKPAAPPLAEASSDGAERAPGRASSPGEAEGFDFYDPATWSIDHPDDAGELQNFLILVAEDDPDDRHLLRRALREMPLRNETRFVDNGQELLDYLCRRGDYAAPGAAPRPGLILLDLNMPLKDGREALREIKAEPSLRRIPIVVLTTSGDDADVESSYDTGANAYLQKPVSFGELVRVTRRLGNFWLEIVRLPRNE